MKKLLIAAAALGFMSAPALAGSFGFETGGSATGDVYANSSSSFLQTSQASAGINGGFGSSSWINGAGGAVVVGGGAIGIGGATAGSSTNVGASFGSNVNGSTNLFPGGSAAQAGFATTFGTGAGFSWN